MVITDFDEYRNNVKRKTKKIKNEPAERITYYVKKIEELGKYSDFFDYVEKCTKCDGKGEKSIWINKKFQNTVQCIYCKHGSVNPLQLYPSEDTTSIKNRLLKNLSIDYDLSKIYFRSDIVNDFIFCIDEFLNGRVRIDDDIREKLASSGYSVDNFILKHWKKSKKKNYPTIISIFVKYLLRTPTSPQTRTIKEVTGIGKKWYRLAIDYYQCYELIKKINADYLRNRQAFKKSEYRNEEERKKTMEASKYSEEDLLRIAFTEQLAWCIENDPIKFHFSEQEFSQLHGETKKILYDKLQNSKSSNAKEFLNQWIKCIENYVADIYESNKDLYGTIISKIQDRDDPMRIIDALLLQPELTKFRSHEDENGMFYDYKTSTFANDKLIQEHVKKHKQKSNVVTNGDLLNKATVSADKQIMDKILQTICAFLNTDGGCILIGVEDNGNICGVEVLKDVYNKRNKTEFDKEKFVDQYRIFIQDRLRDFKQSDIRKKFLNGSIKVHLISIQNVPQKIILITVQRTNDLCFFNYEDPVSPQKIGQTLYVRKNGQNILLTGDELHKKLRSSANQDF